MRSTLCYLSYDGHLNSPIIRTQVLRLLGSAPAACGGLLLAWEDSHAPPLPETERVLLQGNGVGFLTFRRRPLLPGLLYERWRMPRVLRGKYFDVAHARGVKAAFIASALRAAGIVRRVVLDMRGDEASEAKERWHNNPQMRYLADWITVRSLTPRTVRAVDAVTCVSPELARLVQSMVPKSIAPHVIPTASQFVLTEAHLESRAAVRARLKLGDAIALLYVGGEQDYQGLDLLRPFLDGVRQVAPSVHLLCAIHGAGHLSAGVPTGPGVTIIRNADPDVVLDLLLAADVGLLLRHHSPVNRVSAPVKFAEYRTIGLPVIATSASAFVSQSLSSTQDGIVVDNLDPDALSRVGLFLGSLDRSNEARRLSAQRGANVHGMEVIGRQYNDLWTSICASGAL